ncbi:MAG: hypothetical protein KDD64_03985 [Bdellovibrionales bacterium]|nr:hypothetical protein [Bdellovibrionales bacterium]
MTRDPLHTSRNARPLQNESTSKFWSNTAKDIGYAVAGAAIVSAIAAVGIKIDQAVNPEIIQALTDNWSWWKVFTSHHAMAALAQSHPLGTFGVFGAIGAIQGLLARKAFE